MYRPFLLVVHFISSCIFGSSKKSVYHLHFGLLTKISIIFTYHFFDTVAQTLGTCSELSHPKTYFRTRLFVLSTLQYSQPCLETYISIYQYTPCLQLGHAARADLYGLLMVKF